MSAVLSPLRSRIAPTRVRAILFSLLFCLAVLRFAAAVVSAVHLNHGDFFATLPGAYAEQWNLTLWDSPDLKNSRHGYGYGPTQYLTLWPIVFLDSYRQIAMVLLPLYIAMVMGIAYLLWRLCEMLVPEYDGYRWGRLMAVFAAVVLFGPIQIALGQREFEIVQALMIVVAGYFVARGRPVLAGAVLGYISMFKYWVVALLGYFILKRQWKAAVAFVTAVAAVLLVAHATFDLARFRFASRAGIEHQFGKIYEPLAGSLPFCSPIDGTAASLETGLCAIVGERQALAEFLFFGLLAAAGSLFLMIFALFECQGRPADEINDRWRRTLEFCLFLIAAGVVFHGHYYYLSILILPLTVMLYRSLWNVGGAASVRLVLTLLAYAALSPFIVPISVLARVIRGDPWSFYLSYGIYAYGDGILVGLLFWEYWRLLRSARRDVRGRLAGEADTRRCDPGQQGSTGKGRLDLDRTFAG